LVKWVPFTVYETVPVGAGSPNPAVVGSTRDSKERSNVFLTVEVAGRVAVSEVVVANGLDGMTTNDPVPTAAAVPESGETAVHDTVPELVAQVPVLTVPVRVSTP
jgi:hypothetical protein